jgi:hypothetical protein
LDATEKFNPFLQIWFRPRATIRHILDHPSTFKRLGLWVIMIVGIIEALNKASERSLGDSMNTMSLFLIAFLVGPISGIISIWFGSWLLYITGKWINGNGTIEEIKMALAWASVPMLFTIPNWIILLFLYEGELFTTFTPTIDSNYIPFLVIAFIEVVILIWMGFVYLKCIGEAQQFSAWKALLNVIISSLLVIVPIFIIVAFILSLT